MPIITLRKGRVQHKYKNVHITTHGIRFDSKAEAVYYANLLIRVRDGSIVVFTRQVPFHLPGGTRYVCDFLEFHADGTVHFVDVKGFETPAFIKNKKQVEALYAPIEIEVVK